MLSGRRIPRNLPIAILSLAFAGIGAWLIAVVNDYWQESPEKAAATVGAMFAVCLILSPVFYLAKKRSFARGGDIGLVFIAALCVLLVACYFYYAACYVAFRGDFFIWSESDFVNDIIKFRRGYPIFTADANNESFAYMPGAQILTYSLARIIGQGDSIQTYRAVQIGYTILAAVIAFFCCRRLLPPEISAGKLANSGLWGIILLCGLLLIATNYRTNPFVQLLHNDALAQLISVSGYWLLLEYEHSKDKRILWLMALIPTIGFWVKQSLAVWAILYIGYFVFFEERKSYLRLGGFALAAFGGVFLSYLLGCLIWGDHFVYWVFTVLGKHAVSPLRSFQHFLDIWIYFFIGLLGGLALIGRENFKKLFGYLLLWLIFLSIETYTSGVAWMLNHTGPGCLIAGIWFFAGMTAVWSKLKNRRIVFSDKLENFRVVTVCAAVCLIFSGLNFVRIPVKPLGTDSERYISEIEAEFKGANPNEVLLDFGSWVYLPSGTIMKDRAATIGERGYSQTGDFSGIINRFEKKSYSKILVRNLHSPDFWYDHELWSASSGIRDALLENYRKERIIKKSADFSDQNRPYGFQEISVLVPR